MRRVGSPPTDFLPILSLVWFEQFCGISEQNIVAFSFCPVASGEIDQGVIDNDIDAELSQAEAHAQYGARLADWLAINCHALGVMEEVEAAVANMAGYEAETEEFLKPFVEVHNLEQQGFSSQFVQIVQVTNRIV